MLHEEAQVSIVAWPAALGECELCTTQSVELASAAVIQHPRGGRVELAACEPCVFALRRIAAAAGGRARFNLTPRVSRSHAEETVRPRRRTAVSDDSPELIQEFEAHLQDVDGTEYVASVLGRPRPDGNWEGWIEFASIDGDTVLRTQRETTQSSRESLLYWASGLEPTYLQGSFERASKRQLGQVQ